MKTMRDRFLGVGALTLLSALSLFGGNKLSVVRTSINTLEVQLTNSEDVGGVQFSLNASSDIVINSLERGLRTEDSHWMVGSYRPNDSTVNVVILSMERKNLSVGQGTLARIPFTTVNSLEMSHACLTNVMVANPNADSLGVIINNLEWSNKSAIASNSDQTGQFMLGQNFPNPFNPSTKIAYRLNKAAQVRLSVYDTMGREVNRLVDQYQHVGDYHVIWNSNATNQELASGMYFARLSVDDKSVTRKMVLTK